MGTTRTTASDRAHRARRTLSGTAWWPPSPEYLALCLATAVTLAALALTLGASDVALAQVAAGIGRGDVVDVSAADAPALERVLTPVIREAADRHFTATVIQRFLTHDGERPAEADNVGALSRIRITADAAKRAGSERLLARVPPRDDATIPVLTTAEVAQLKPSLVVRDPSAFRAAVLWSVVLYVLSAHGVALYWRFKNFTGDPWLLPIAHLLTGLGMAAMLALQDPLRDRLLIAEFAEGVALGCLALAVFSSQAYGTSPLRRLSFVPLIAAALLSVLLIVFGSGPGTSDARVNLFGMQPVEIIRVLLVLYLAGYFAARWEFLRQLREEQFGGLELPKRFRVPRYDHVLPLVVGVALALVLFFLQKDLGPALVFGSLFLALYGVARKELVLVTAGIVLMLGGFFAGYQLGYPHTIRTRVAMWLSPWENGVRGGDHVAQSLWAFASGGPSGTGLGLGEPASVAEAHTDMVLATLGEELGFAGLFAITVLFALLFHRGFLIARRAGGDYAFFLALGLTLSLALPVLLIAGGTLGMFPLSGVATPFLSYGKSSMIANFVVLGILIGISRENVRSEPVTAPFVRPMRVVAGVLAALGLLLVGRAASVQVLHADSTMALSSLTPQADGVMRYQDNPRLRRAASLLPRGTVFDRRGIPLALSDCSQPSTTVAVLRQSGATGACDSRTWRHYPFGGDTYHILGDARTRTNFSASNTSFEERDHDARLRGFDDREEAVERTDPRSGRPIRVTRRDYGELVPLWRYRHRPEHPEVRRLHERPRDLHVTIDVRLQAQLSRALDRHLGRLRRTRGSIVVMDAESGEVLALVNAPRPRVTDAAILGVEAPPPPEDPAWFDRARYGIYPPGSTFKLVTAAAALRKDPALGETTFMCGRLPGGRVGRQIPGWSRPIRDDELDTHPHGAVDLRKGVEQSCNAYFAQLALHIGAGALHDTGELFQIELAQPDTVEQLRGRLPQAGYGQGDVTVTPFKMARVAAAIANGGRMPYGRWVGDTADRRAREAVPVMTKDAAAQLASYMRGVVLRGTGRTLSTVSPAIAGKTGTAEVQRAASHSWFAGFAPYGTTIGRRLAFAILVENGGYGGRAAAPLAADIVRIANELGLLDDSE